MTPSILIKIHKALDHQNPIDAVFWCVCIFAFLLLFRKSNLVPQTRSSFEKDKQLTWQDLVITKNNIIVGIRWAKNEQFEKDLMTHPLPIIKGSELCPLDALQNMFKLIKPSKTDHLFTLGSGVSFTYPRFQSMLHRVLVDIGIQNASSYGSHSFRRGGATFAFLCGVPAEIIKVLGNWKSDCYLKYLHLPLEARIVASELVKIRIMHQQYHY